MIAATMTTRIEDIGDQKLCENNTEGDNGQRSETETVLLDSAPVSSQMHYGIPAKSSAY
jgi:hypothetical protein